MESSCSKNFFLRIAEDMKMKNQGTTDLPKRNEKFLLIMTIPNSTPENIIEKDNKILNYNEI